MFHGIYTLRCDKPRLRLGKVSIRKAATFL